MAERPRSYSELNETHHQVADGLAPSAAHVRQSLEADLNSPDRVEAMRDAYTQLLQAKVQDGKIPGSDMSNRLSRFDSGEPIAVREAQQALTVREEARENAIAARAREDEAALTKDQENERG